MASPYPSHTRDRPCLGMELPGVPEHLLMNSMASSWFTTNHSIVNAQGVYIEINEDRENIAEELEAGEETDASSVTTMTILHYSPNAGVVIL